MCLAPESTYPIQGERLERLKARNADGSPTFPGEWAQWIRQESPALESHLRNLLRRQPNVEKDTEDALNNVWLTLFKKVGPRYDRSELWRVFLFDQARAAASEVIRKGKREQPLGGARSGKEDADSDVESCILNQLAARGIDDEAELRREFDELLELAQSKLTDLARTIVRRRIDGETFAKIAAHIGSPLGTITTTYYRALQALQALVKSSSD